ncbi:MAG: AAA family ATPase [Planctomycetes bacterium]|nr:AAA family ATPase [Planctomycetota bacterium]
MATADTLAQLKSRILSHFSMMFLSTWEEERWEGELAALATEMDRGLVTWTVTRGAQPSLDGNAAAMINAAEFLRHVPDFPRDQLFLLKDFHPHLADPHILRQLRDLMPALIEQNKTLLFMGPETEIPVELQKDALKFHLPLPGLDELHTELKGVLAGENAHRPAPLLVSSEQEERLVRTMLGLTAAQARKSFQRAFLGRSEIDEEIYSQLIGEKKVMVQGSEMLEFQELTEGVKDIGGLDGLKDWVTKRSLAFSEKARSSGIPAPKGVLLLGVQGCGKSLTSRAIAKLLAFPLVRLDVATLLSGDKGQSEKNMRDVLALMEMIAPAVLWLDEIEKGFAGANAETGSDSTMVRIMGRFLTWMQENPAPVFVVATANSVTGLPPEMLRRGRFDELFFVDLPNYHERKQILEIHLRKRGFDSASFDIAKLAERSEGYSGAELEQVVLAAMVETYGGADGITQAALEKAREETVPLSVTMEEKIFQLREWAKGRCRPATPDSRVLQMLEAEQRQKAKAAGDEHSLEDKPFAFDPTELEPEETDVAWKTPAQSGDLPAALLEYVRTHDGVTIPQLQSVFAEFLATSGEQGLALRSDPNLILWLGLSAEFAGELSKLISNKRLFLRIVDTAAFGESETEINLPKVISLPDNKVSKPAWLPTCLTDLAPEAPDSRLERVARMMLAK